MIGGKSKAEKDYFVTTAYLVELASNAAQLFESSESEQKRQILNLVLQNQKLDKKKIRYTLKYPFNILTEYHENFLR